MTTTKSPRELLADVTAASTELAARVIEHDIDRSKITAYEELVRRQSDAHNFCRNIPSANAVGTLGRNVWHVVLDEAIRLRRENADLRERPATVESSILSDRIGRLERAHLTHAHACYTPVGGGGYGKSGPPE